MSKQLVYLASPYSHPNDTVRHARFHIACKVAAKLMHQGVLVFSPIAHSHPIVVAGDLPTGWEFWEKYDRAVLSACRAVYVLILDGWEESIGIHAEIKIAKEMDIPILYVNEFGVVKLNLEDFELSEGL